MTMKIRTGLAIAGIMLISSGCYAQDSLSGKYTGTIGGSGLTLAIDSVDSGAVKATIAVSYTSTRLTYCNGSHPLAGTLKGQDLELHLAPNAEKAKDCPFKVLLTVNGNSLIGATGSGVKVELSK